MTEKPMSDPNERLEKLERRHRRGAIITAIMAGGSAATIGLGFMWYGVTLTWGFMPYPQFRPMVNIGLTVTLAGIGFIALSFVIVYFCLKAAIPE